MKLSLGSYLKASEVKHYDLLIIADEGKEVISSKFKNGDGSDKINHEFTVILSDGSKKKLNFNMTSLRMVAEKFGSDTALWVDKTVRVNKAKTATGADMILLEPLD